MSRPAHMFQGTPVAAFTASRFHWPSGGIRRQVRAVKMPSDVPKKVFICLICLAKPDSEIHLVRSFLFSQLFEGLTFSDERLLAHQTSARSPCRLFQSNLGSWFNHWLSFGIVHPALPSASQAMARPPCS